MNFSFSPIFSLENQKEKILKLWICGCDTQQIAVRVGVTEAQVYNFPALWRIVRNYILRPAIAPPVWGFPAAPCGRLG
jgi:hypothetical protein